MSRGFLWAFNLQRLWLCALAQVCQKNTIPTSLHVTHFSRHSNSSHSHRRLDVGNGGNKTHQADYLLTGLSMKPKPHYVSRCHHWDAITLRHLPDFIGTNWPGGSRATEIHALTRGWHHATVWVQVKHISIQKAAQLTLMISLQPVQPSSKSDTKFRTNNFTLYGMTRGLMCSSIMFFYFHMITKWCRPPQRHRSASPVAYKHFICTVIQH